LDGGGANYEPCEYIADGGHVDIKLYAEPFIYNYDTIKVDRLTKGSKTVTLNSNGAIAFANDSLVIGSPNSCPEIVTKTDLSFKAGNNTVKVTKSQLRVSKSLYVSNNIQLQGKLLDALSRPIFNVNALDINTDGGTSVSVFSMYDLQFDGGSVSTVFGSYEAGLDGGSSFNNLLSSQYIDGGSALVH
jgi:hypothetical protein